MKFLFIVQGEGRGHLTQAITLEEMLLRNGHEVVEVLVGKSSSRTLPGFFNRSIHAPVKRFISPNFLPAADSKRPSLKKSVFYNLRKIPEYFRSMCYINQRIKETGAEIVINFYELLTGLTYAFFRPAVPYVCIGHQYLFLHRDFEFPKKNFAQLWMLRFFTRMTAIRASKKLALSFRTMEQDDVHRIVVVPPLIRQEVTKVDETLRFYQIDDIKFLNGMAGCRAYASTAGFESICEAMYLGKPVLMVPAHIEQDCNAYDAMRAGAGIISDSFDLESLLRFAGRYTPNRNFTSWVRSCERRIIFELEETMNVVTDEMYMVESFV